MKKIIVFFVNIWIFLFGKKVKETEKVTGVKKVIRPNGPQTGIEIPSPSPSHNNRKSKKGRLVQYISLKDGSGRKRAIYHSAK